MTKKRKVGSFIPHQNAPIPGAKVVKSDKRYVEKMNQVLRKKCEEQRKNEAIASIMSKHFIVR